MSSVAALELTKSQDASGTRLQGRRLVMARTIWAMLVVLTMSLFITMLPAYFRRMQTLCIRSECALGQASPDTARLLQEHGLTVTNYAIFAVALTVFVTVICAIVALLIIRRKSDDWVALLVALTLVMEGTTFVTYTIEWSPSVWLTPAFIMSTFSWSAIYLLFALFPDGHFVPRWTQWLVIIWISYSIVATIFPVLAFTLLSDLIWLGLCACSVIAQIYRYRHVSDKVQRQQTKWIVYGTSVATTVVIALDIPFLLVPSLGPGSLYSLLSWCGFMLALVPFPLSIGFAVQHSRLWDIDNIINRTLVYTLLTVLLVVLYFGSVALLQYLIHTFTGQNSPIAVVVSTLTIAILFHPLRGYLQKTIDRYFYRRRYDITEVLARFDNALRNLYSGDEENLTLFTMHVQQLVEETLQPFHMSLCLYEPELTKATDGNTHEVQNKAETTAGHCWEEQEEALHIRLQVSDEQCMSRSHGDGEKARYRLQFRRGCERIVSRVVWSAPLRDRLKDSDVLINRALIYGMLVGILGLASTGILIIQQELAQVASSQVAEFFIVGSILAMVMCFKPLHHHIQVFVNRNFYRHKYQAQRRLDDFTEALRREGNLAQLREGLLEAVGEAMEPEHLSLWINKPEPETEKIHYTGILQP